MLPSNLDYELEPRTDGVAGSGTTYFRDWRPGSHDAKHIRTEGREDRAGLDYARDDNGG